jgi:hypothetical protein
MIPEPQRTYVLELLEALGPAAKDFVIAGAQAIKFAVKDARGTKDVDFILNVIALRAEPLQLEAVLKRLSYTAIAGARNFQFEKTIPNSKEIMRIEFMAPEEFKRAADFRVDVQKGIHARACTGGTIALAESDEYPLEGRLPDGEPYAARVRVTRPHALVMLSNSWLSLTAITISGARRKRGTIARKRRRMRRTLWRSSKRARTGQSSGGSLRHSLPRTRNWANASRRF